MSENRNTKSKRIAKNTMLLYVRMLFLMAIGFFTSRVVLQTLGVEDFGIHNVVGGFVALFAVVSQSLSSAASRFLNYEMGRGNDVRLSKVFASTLIIHFFLAIIILVLAEAVGIWFVNNKMVIPPDRLYAANWVFQFSVLSFCITIITVPYNAAIIAHEKMNAFAYISIFDGIAKLLICYLLVIAPFDKLIFYSLLLLITHFISRGLYYVYSKKHFQECHAKFIYDKSLLTELFSYAGWNFIGASSAIIRNQGGNILINLFFGPAVNAARGVANQVLHAVQGFTDNFITALKPQITKSYASGDHAYMMTLIFYGSRLSYYMLLILSLPILLNTDYLLHLWLKTVPDHSALFVKLILVFTMCESLSQTLITAQLATGEVKNYQLLVGGLQLLNIPVSYVILKMGGVPETIMYVAIFFSFCCLAGRLYMLSKNSVQLNIWGYINRVIMNVLVVSILSAVIPFLIKRQLEESFISFVIITIVSLLCTTLSILYVGFSKKERQMVISKVMEFINKKMILKTKNE